MNKQRKAENNVNSYLNKNKKSKDSISAIQQTQMTKASEFAKMVYSMQKNLAITQTK